MTSERVSWTRVMSTAPFGYLLPFWVSGDRAEAMLESGSVRLCLSK